MTPHYIIIIIIIIIIIAVRPVLSFGRFSVS
jgi:hypothetical protein